MRQLADDIEKEKAIIVEAEVDRKDPPFRIQVLYNPKPPRTPKK